ncbi:hypothetical protein RCH09_003841 [Actimicrobium sp. GrIS 1.19]|uniref:hypothetical protein n=1 Tax=Actimicrobium sp. GrIS 1.19 TaxID=3071708 RepID=UPI002E07FBB9|nr:hypothetical protein [Actimicrobium sp. GrIS 1.19]
MQDADVNLTRSAFLTGREKYTTPEDTTRASQKRNDAQARNPTKIFWTNTGIYTICCLMVMA